MYVHTPPTFEVNDDLIFTSGEVSVIELPWFSIVDFDFLKPIRKIVIECSASVSGAMAQQRIKRYRRA